MAEHPAGTEMTPTEVMTIHASRLLSDGQVCLVGVGPPNAAVNLARRLQAPGCVLVYESGAIGSKPQRLPLSIGDEDLAETADALVSVPEMFAYWIGGGRIDVGFLGAAQIDRRGNINTTVIGEYGTPVTRLPGAGGAPEIASAAGQVFVMARHSKRSFVEQVDFRTSVARRGADAAMRVVTDLGILSRAEDGELELTGLHQGVGVEQALECTGWPLRVADELEISGPISETELSTLRALRDGTR